MVGNGGVGSLVDYVAETSGNNRLPGIMALGYIAAFSETLALSVIAEKALPPLVQAINDETEDHLKSATAWTLGQIGRHTPDHAKVSYADGVDVVPVRMPSLNPPFGSFPLPLLPQAVSDTGVLTTLVGLEGDSTSSEDLKTKCRRALKSIIGKLTHLPALDALVHRNLPEGVMKMVLEQVSCLLRRHGAV